MRQAEIDRRGDDRGDPVTMAAHRADPRALLVRMDATGHFETLRLGGQPSAGSASDGAESLEVFLGVGSSGPWFATRAEVSDRAASLREGGGACDEEREAAVAAAAVLAWHDSNPPCERCAARTTPAPAGFSRQCVSCGQMIFPRTDPAMIVALVDSADRLLLAHQVVWPLNRASLLAGFNEAGESVEHTVAREVEEEAGLQISSLRYLVSQAWPFPRSLMLAYVARADGEPVVDGVEIEWARWFDRAELDDEVARGQLTLPGPGSVARRVIDLWRQGQLPRPEDAPVL